MQSEPNDVLQGGPEKNLGRAAGEAYLSVRIPSLLDERRRDRTGFILPSMLAALALGSAIVVFAFAAALYAPAAGLLAAIGIVFGMRRAASHRLQLAIARKPRRRR